MGEGTKCCDHGATLAGPLWFAGWLFTWGLLHLGMPKALFALLLWPYYLGVALQAAGLNRPERRPPGGLPAGRSRVRACAQPFATASTRPGYAASAAARHFIARSSTGTSST